MRRQWSTTRRRNVQPSFVLVLFFLVGSLINLGGVVRCEIDDNNTVNRQLLGLRGGVDSDLDEAAAAALSSHPPPPPKQHSTVPIGNFSVPLHAHSGSHHVHVYVGSPPQRQTLIVDTGSRAMAFPCKLQCKSCGVHASPYFDPLLSTTFRTSKCRQCKLRGVSTCSLFGDTCEISQKYTEGSSWTATEVEDVVWLGTDNVVNSVEVNMQSAIIYAFGCQTSSKGLFKKQYADGILGLARHDTSMVAAYADAKAIPRNAFSLCLTQDGGIFSMGGSLPLTNHVEPMKLTPITHEHGWYSIQVVSVRVGGDYKIDSAKHLTALNGGKGCILDSGTTDTYMPKSLAKTISRMVLDVTEGLTDFSSKWRQKLYTYADFLQLPEIVFEFSNNVTLALVADNYMEGVPIDPMTGGALHWKGTKLLTNRIYLEESEGTVLGANAMFGHDILFDTHGHQIGIAKANCNHDSAIRSSSSVSAV